MNIMYRFFYTIHLKKFTMLISNIIINNNLENL